MSNMNRIAAIKELLRENIKGFVIDEVNTEYLSKEMERLPEGESKSSVLRKLAELEQMTNQRVEHQRILKRMLREEKNK